MVFLIFLVILVSGCVGEKKETTTTKEITTTTEETTTTTITTTTTTSTTIPDFEPLKLTYSLKNVGFEGEAKAVFWLEEKRKCGDREAYLGLARVEGLTNGGDGPDKLFAKITIYLDNGEMAITSFVNREEELAFDDLSSQYNDFNIPLTLNTIFVYAGKNFNSHEYWNSTTPVVLKNVDTGSSFGNYSIIRQEEDSSGVIPCRKFKIVAKTTEMDGFFNTCVTEKIGKINLPFMESLQFENDQGPSWKLAAYSTEKSGIAWYPQCLTPVRCTYVRMTPGSERIACESKGGEIQQISDEKGCVKEYKCRTQEEIVEGMIRRTQRPDCAINTGVKKKLLDCRKNKKYNFDSTYDNSGCITDVTCR